MRNAFCKAMLALKDQESYAFFTGDLGFMALEPLRQALGGRFINAGVAEQNMVSVAAGVAGEGTQAWVYSIAPFIFARPFEQVRNDVCLHGLDVKLVGNGGGYGYGPMGATHHALEDYGALLTLPRIQAFIPAFAEDLAGLVPELARRRRPGYLRLGRDEKPAGFIPAPWAPWRRLAEGAGPVIAAVGPLAGPLLDAIQALPASTRPELWCLGELPLDENPPPPEFLGALKRGGHLAVAEEHTAQGSAGQMLIHWLGLRGLAPRRFNHAHAQGYPSGNYGSQGFHRAENGLDPQGILKLVQSP